MSEKEAREYARSIRLELASRRPQISRLDPRGRAELENWLRTEIERAKLILRDLQEARDGRLFWQAFEKITDDSLMETLGQFVPRRTNESKRDYLLRLRAIGVSYRLRVDTPDSVSTYPRARARVRKNGVS